MAPEKTPNDGRQPLHTPARYLRRDLRGNAAIATGAYVASIVRRRVGDLAHPLRVGRLRNRQAGEVGVVPGLWGGWGRRNGYVPDNSGRKVQRRDSWLIASAGVELPLNLGAAAAHAGNTHSLA